MLRNFVSDANVYFTFTKTLCNNVELSITKTSVYIITDTLVGGISSLMSAGIEVVTRTTVCYAEKQHAPPRSLLAIL